MSSVDLRIPLGLGEKLLDHVFQTGTHECVAFGLVSHAQLRRRPTLLLRKIVVLREEDYLPTRAHGATWRGAAMFPLMGDAVDDNLGILVIHAHDHEGPPRLSGDDLASAARLIPMFRNRVPSRPHGTVVVSRTHATGRIWLPDRTQPSDLGEVRWFGSAITDWTPATAISGENCSAFVRQSLVVGGQGQGWINRAKVAVVGLGGGGSHVVQQLTYLGIGEIVAIDSDTFEETNHHRVVGAGGKDLGRRKVDIMYRLVRQINLHGRLRRIHARIPNAVAVSAVRDCDIIVGCVDTLFTRSDLQELASRYLIPYVDVGVSIRPVETNNVTDRRVSISGNIVTFIPGGFCMWCSGFITDEKLKAEQQGPTRGYFEKNNDEAQVVSLNGVVSSQAVTEVLQLLTGFGGASVRTADTRVPGADVQRGYKKFDGVSGTLQEWGATRRKDCNHCRETLAAGDLIF